MDTRHIMFIDDQALPNELYVRALRREGHKVKFVHDTDEAMDFVNRRLEDFDVVVLDLMMPPGDTFSSRDTDAGLRTGDFLFIEIRNRHAEIPIVVLTNRKHPPIPGTISHDNASIVVAKIDCTPDELVRAIESEKWAHYAR